jgi:hypothetical protein
MDTIRWRPSSGFRRRESLLETSDHGLPDAASHCLEIGTKLDEDELVRWAYIAAGGEHATAVWTAPLIEASCSQQAECWKLRVSYLILGACIGSKPSLLALRALDSNIYSATRAAIQQRHRPDFGLDHGISSFMKFLDSPALDAATCSLVDAIRSQNVERARQLLQEPLADVANLVDGAGQNVLHLLTYLEDEETEGLASLCHDKGASLDQTATEFEPATLFLHRAPIRGTPLLWAAAKGMWALFWTLLRLHEQTGVTIRGAVARQIAVNAAAFHHSEILRRLLAQLKQTPRLFQLEDDEPLPDTDSEVYMALLLLLTVQRVDVMQLLRRTLHGSNFRDAQADTFGVLLNEITNLFKTLYTRFPTDDSIVYLLLATDNDKCLSLFMQTIRRFNEEDILTAMVSSLQKCILEDSVRCFKIIWHEFPQLVNYSGVLGSLIPLFVAAGSSNPIYAKMLLERRADVTVVYMHRTPLSRAVMDGRLKTADIIYSFCTDQNKQHAFGFSEVTGSTLMGRVLAVWTKGTKTQELISAMQ